jgi:hypothetical protein
MAEKQLQHMSTCQALSQHYDLAARFGILCYIIQERRAKDIRTFVDNPNNIGGTQTTSTQISSGLQRTRAPPTVEGLGWGPSFVVVHAR